MGRIPDNYDNQLAGFRDRYWVARPLALNPQRGADVLSDRCRDAEERLVDAHLHPSRRALAQARRFVERIERMARTDATLEQARLWLEEGRASGLDKRYRESEKQLAAIYEKANEEFALARGEPASVQEA